MDYEKKYKEALEWMRGVYPTLTGAAREDAEHFFPELAESEDEKIKKGLIELIENWNYPQELFTTKRNIIAYLKKQKEQEHPCDSAQFEEGFKTGYELGLRKKEEQKPAEWSEEDETMLRTIISDGSRGVELDSKQISWLKSLRPVKQEWSDEDEKTRRNLMSLLANMRGDRITEETYQKYYPWLKDLHPSWKPSGEQMNALYDVIHPCDPVDKEQLESLYEQLKKL